MSQEQSSIIYVPYKFLCPNHNKEVNHLNLTPDHPKEKRLLCVKCNYNGQSNLMHINDVFCFLTDLDKKSQTITQSIDAMFNKYQDAKQKIITYIDYIGRQFEELRRNIELNKTIKDGILRKYLSKDSKNNVDDLISLISLLSVNVNLTDKIQLKKDFYSPLEQDMTAKLEQGVNIISNISLNLPKDAIKVQSNQLGIIQPPVTKQISMAVQNFAKTSEIDFPSNIFAISFNKSGQLLALGGAKIKEHNCFLQIWKVNEQNQVTLFSSLKGHQRDVKTICFSQVDDSFLSGSVDNKIIHWKQLKPYEWTMCQTLEGHSLAVNCIKFNHLENFVASGSSEIIVWHKNVMNNNEWAQKFEFKNDKQILSLSFSEDSRLLVSGTADMLIHIFESIGGEWQMQQTIPDQSATVNFVAFISSNTFITAQSDNQIIFWNFSAQDSEFKQQGIISDKQFKAVNYCDSRRLFVTSNDVTTIIHQISNNNQIKSLQVLPVKSYCLSFQADGSQIAVASEGKLNIYHEQIK